MRGTCKMKHVNMTALVAILALVIWAWFDMRRAEKRRDDAKRK